PNRRGAERALAAGADELSAVVSASATHNLKNLKRTPDETIAEIAGVIELAHAAGRPVDAAVATCFGCPYEGDIDPALVAAYARGASGNIATEDLVHMVEDLGISTGISLDGLIAAAHLAEEIVGRRLPGQVMRAGPRTLLVPAG